MGAGGCSERAGGEAGGRWRLSLSAVDQPPGCQTASSPTPPPSAAESAPADCSFSPCASLPAGAYDAQDFAKSHAKELGMKTVPSLNVVFTEEKG